MFVNLTNKQPMKTLQFTLTFVLFLALGQKVKAQTTYTNACYVASTGRIWEATGGCGYYVTTCDGTDPDGEYAVITSGLGATCTPCGGGPNGKRVTIDVLHCSIDGYALALIGASIGLVYFNRKKLK